MVAKGGTVPGPRAGVDVVIGVGFIAVANSNILINFVGKYSRMCRIASEWVQIRWQLDSCHKFWVFSFRQSPNQRPLPLCVFAWQMKVLAAELGLDETRKGNCRRESFAY